MRLRNETDKSKLERLLKWHVVFAWWPVRVSETERVWLEPVARRAEPGTTWPVLRHEFEYATREQAFEEKTCKPETF